MIIYYYTIYVGGGGGDHISSSSKSKIKIRFVLGAWCLVCFVLITAYSSVLTSFIMAPHYKLFISSLRELVENEEANPVIVQNVGIVGFIQVYKILNTYYTLWDVFSIRFRTYNCEITGIY